MANQILADTKELLGIPTSLLSFDGQLIPLINTVLTTLTQMGVGPVEGYQVTSDSGSMDEFLPGNDEIHSTVQTYIFEKVRIIFDPPVNQVVMTALQDHIKELEWRLKDFSSGSTTST